MIKFRQTGNFNRTERLLNKIKRADYVDILVKYGQRGVEALSAATPVDTGLTASSWGYEIVKMGSSYRVYWSNSNVNKGVVIALILQMGHGTGTGGWVEGRDYINPAIRPVFDAMAKDAWEEVMSDG